MTKLSDTQLTILSAAAQRPDGNLLPLPGSLRGGAAGKVVGALLARGLICEQIIDSARKADAALNTLWRNSRTAAACCSSSRRRARRPRDRGRRGARRAEAAAAPQSGPPRRG